MLIITNTLSVVLICMCLFVVYKWCGPIHSYAKKFSQGKSLDSYDWLIVGVFISFLSKTLDSSYWLIPWTLKAIGSPSTEYFMSIGINFNLFFRVALGSLAAFCHIKSIYLHNTYKNIKPSKAVMFCVVVGVVYFMVIMEIKWLS